MLPVVSAHMPIHDGDMAELEELQERIFDELDNLLTWDVPFGIDYGQRPYCYEHVSLGFPLGLRYWPDDRAAEQLAIWRAQIDGIA
jgi:hypothetical protein